MFAQTEDDLIEFSWSLLDKGRCPKNLYEFLREKHVLMIGCNFPDWLGRFFIRAIWGERKDFGYGSMRFVTTQCEHGLRQYLCRRGATVYEGVSPVDFIKELHGRWTAGSTPVGATPVPPDPTRLSDDDRIEFLKRFPGGGVFISYPSQDRAKARVIREQLEGMNVPTWWDQDLQGGQDYERFIQQRIQTATFFLAVMSESLRRESQQDSWILREWRKAAHVNEGRPLKNSFLLPVSIDGTKPDADFVEPPMNAVQWRNVDGAGSLPRDLTQLIIGRIRTLLDGARKAEQAD